MLKKIVICSILSMSILSSTAHAEIGFPSSNVNGYSGPSQYDEFTSRNGSRCRNAIATGRESDIYLDTGVSHSTGGSSMSFDDNGNTDGNTTVYARIVIPLGKKLPNKISRIDCSKIYELEVRKMEQEIRLLRLQIEKAKND